MSTDAPRAVDAALTDEQLWVWERLATQTTGGEGYLAFSLAQACITLLATLRAARAEAAALRIVVDAARHYIVCENVWVKTGMGGTAARDADSAATQLREALAALAPPEPRRVDTEDQ